MLEDDFTWVLRKALAGNGLAPSQAAARAGLPETAVLESLRGRFSAEVARALAPVLGLNAGAFATHPSYQPAPVVLDGVRRIDLPFGDERVNVWLVRAGNSTVMFDAGFRLSDLIDHLAPPPDAVFITHAHRDHVGALEHLLASGLPVHAAEIPGTRPMKPGDTARVGALAVTALDLSGHASPALGFHVGGLATPVLVTGDALYAGSIGGCASPAIYQHALARLRAELPAYPDETVLLPGHGPATTLGGERVSNPFLRV